MLLHWWQGSSLNLPSQPAAIHRNLRVASVILYLSPTCLPLISHLSPTCLPLVSQLSHCLVLVSYLFATVSHHPLGAVGRLVLHSSPTCHPLSLTMLWVLWATWFYTCLPLSSTMLWVLWAAWFYSCLWLSPTCLPLSKLVSDLFPIVSHYALCALGRMILGALGFSDAHSNHQFFTPNWNILKTFENVLHLFGVNAGIVIHIQYIWLS